MISALPGLALIGTALASASSDRDHVRKAKELERFAVEMIDLANRSEDPGPFLNRAAVALQVIRSHIIAIKDHPYRDTLLKRSIDLSIAIHAAQDFMYTHEPQHRNTKGGHR